MTGISEPSCPHCGKVVPYRLLLWGLGKPFACAHCGRPLVVPRGSGVGIALLGFLAFWRFQDARPGWQWQLGLALLIGLIVAIASWLTLRVRPSD